MHLTDVTASRLQMTVQFMHNIDIHKVVPLHCTGIFAICEMKKLLGDRCQVVCAGDSLKL